MADRKSVQAQLLTALLAKPADQDAHTPQSLHRAITNTFGNSEADISAGSALLANPAEEGHSIASKNKP